jgi:glycine cleavage system H protein
VTAVNDLLSTSPEKLNEDPHGAAWLIKLKLSTAAEINDLLSADDYQKYIGAE